MAGRPCWLGHARAGEAIQAMGVLNRACPGIAMLVLVFGSGGRGSTALGLGEACVLVQPLMGRRDSDQNDDKL